MGIKKSALGTWSLRRTKSKQEDIGGPMYIVNDYGVNV
jgi:hypothetical protein